jgi:hypothetical protein
VAGRPVPFSDEIAANLAGIDPLTDALTSR